MATAGAQHASAPNNVQYVAAGAGFPNQFGHNAQTQHRQAYNAANNGPFEKYYCGVHPTTYKECCNLSTEAKNFLRERDKAPSYEPDYPLGGGQRGEPTAEFVHGTDFPRLSEQAIQNYRESLEAAAKAGAKPPANPTSNRKRANFWDPQWKPLPPAMRAFKIKRFEDLRPGVIGWLHDNQRKWHLAVILSIDYETCNIKVLIFYTYGGKGLDGRQDQAHAFAKPWHPRMRGSYRKSRDGPHNPIRVDGKNFRDDKYSQPAQSQFADQFSDQAYLRLWPPVELRVDRMVAIIGWVSPATLRWLLRYVDECATLKLAENFDSAVRDLDRDDIINRLREDTMERIEADGCPAGTAADIDFAFWFSVEKGGNAMEKWSGDPIRTQWAKSEPRASYLMRNFVKNLEILLRVFDKICSPAGRRCLGAVAALSIEQLTGSYMATMELVEMSEAVAECIGRSGTTQVGHIKRALKKEYAVAREIWAKVVGGILKEHLRPEHQLQAPIAGPVAVVPKESKLTKLVNNLSTRTAPGSKEEVPDRAARGKDKLVQQQIDGGDRGEGLDVVPGAERGATTPTVVDTQQAQSMMLVADTLRHQPVTPVTRMTGPNPSDDVRVQPERPYRTRSPHGHPRRQEDRSRSPMGRNSGVQNRGQVQEPRDWRMDHQSDTYIPSDQGIAPPQRVDPFRGSMSRPRQSADYTGPSGVGGQRYGRRTAGGD